jgi:hypothetical protein
MKALRVIDHLDAIEHITVEILPCDVDVLLNSLPFQ